MVDDLDSIISAPQLMDWRELPIGKIDITIAKNGEWFYQGSVITRKALVKLLASQLRRWESNYYLVAPEQRLKISVEDLPFVAHSVVLDRSKQVVELRVTLNTDETIVVGGTHAIELVPLPDSSDESIPAIYVRNGLLARMSRSAYYQLVELAMQQQDDAGRNTLTVTSQHNTYVIGYF